MNAYNALSLGYLLLSAASTFNSFYYLYSLYVQTTLFDVMTIIAIKAIIAPIGVFSVCYQRFGFLLGFAIANTALLIWYCIVAPIDAFFLIFFTIIILLSYGISYYLYKKRKSK